MVAVPLAWLSVERQGSTTELVWGKLRKEKVQIYLVLEVEYIWGCKPFAKVTEAKEM